MRVSKLLRKGISAQQTPIFGGHIYTEGEPEVSIGLHISKTNSMGEKRGSYLVIRTYKTDDTYKIKISNREAYKLLRSNLIYRG